jgi:hypothetical protein
LSIKKIASNSVTVLWQYQMDQWTVKWTYQYTPGDGRVAAEIYVGLIEQKYENKKCILWLKKEKFLYPSL